MNHTTKRRNWYGNEFYFVMPNGKTSKLFRSSLNAYKAAAKIYPHDDVHRLIQIKQRKDGW